jgi:hypothetical protein
MCSQIEPKKGIVLTNHLWNIKRTDLLCEQSLNGVCKGSILKIETEKDEEKQKDTVLEEALDFLRQYFDSKSLLNTEKHRSRVLEVLDLLEKNGDYEPTLDELEFGAKTAWRNGVLLFCLILCFL